MGFWGWEFRSLGVRCSRVSRDESSGMNYFGEVGEPGFEIVHDVHQRLGLLQRETEREE